MSQNENAATLTRETIDGHRLAEFVYGTVTGMVALAAMSTHPKEGWLETVFAVILGASAIWLAHAYSIMLSKRVTAGRRLTRDEVLHTMRGSWPIVSAGVVLAVPLMLCGLGLWSVETGLALSGYLGVVMLALCGMLAGVITKETWTHRLLLAAVYGGLGVAVVAVEYLANH